MRKLWLVLTLVTAFTVAAVAAQAGSVPTRLNGSSWNYTAFQMDKYTTAAPTAAPYVAFGTMLNSTYNSTGDGQMMGSLDNYSAAAGPVSTFQFGGSNSSQWRADSSFGDTGFLGMRTNSTAGLLALDLNNATSTTAHTNENVNRGLYFINNPTQSLFVSLGTNLLGKTATPDDGPHFGMMVQNLTISNNVTDVAGTWYFYTFEGTNSSDLAARAGAMVLTSTGAAGSMSYGSLYNNNATGNGTATDTVTWGKVNGGTAISINGTALGVLADKAFLSQDKNVVIGYDVPTGTGSVRALVALKSGATFSSSAFADASFASMAIFNSNASGSSVGNGTADIFYTNSDRKVFTGNYTSFGSNATRIIDSLVDKTVTVGSTTLGGVTQSTMQVTGRPMFIGRTVSNIYAGLMYCQSSGIIGLQIMVPAATSVSEPVAPSTGEVNTFNTSFTVTGTSGSAVQVIAGTDIGLSGTTVGTSGTSLGTLVSQFENATDTALASQFSLGSATIDRNFPTVSFAVNLGAGNAGNMTVRKITFAGNNKLISELPVPTKFYVEAVTTKAGTVHAMNSTKAFSYRNAGTAITDGSYWITPSGFPTLTLNQSDANKLALGSNYDMWLAILDDGDYDLDPTDAQIADPSGFVSGLGGGGGLGGSSSSDGCVLNPAAGFSVELLLLMLAPLAYFIRRRKK